MCNVSVSNMINSQKWVLTTTLRHFHVFVKHDYNMHAINVLLECRYLLSTSTYSSRFFGSTFYFLESRKFLNYFYFLQSKILGKYFYFLQSNSHLLLTTLIKSHTKISAILYLLEESKVYFWLLGVWDLDITCLLCC